MPAMSRSSRRDFLKVLAGTTVAVSAATLTSSALAGATTAAPPAPGVIPGRTRLIPPSRIGVQLFSIRDKVSSLGFRAVFEELSNIGYSEVEFAGYTQGSVGAITPAEIRTLLDDFGLRAAGTHANRTALLTDTQAQCDIANTLGMPYIGTGSSPTNTLTTVGYQAAAAQWNAAGQIARDNGLKIYQHNHAGEFSFATDNPNIRLYDYFLELTDPDLVFLEMDIYWAYAGAHLYPGFDPVDYVLAHPTRIPLFHIKDGKTNPNNSNGRDIIEFGAGDIPFQSFLSALPDRGAHMGIWEQDNASSTTAGGEPIDSFGNAERSYDRMIALRG